MKVAELIAVLQKLDPEATVVAPFSPNPSEINVEEVGGAFSREETPYSGAVELSRTDPNRQRAARKAVSSGSKKSGSDAFSEDERAIIREADTDAPV